MATEKKFLMAAAGAAGGGVQGDFWINVSGGAEPDYGNAVAVDSLDNIIVTGETSSDGAGGADLLIAKYNSSGVLQWERLLGGTGSDQSQGVAIDSLDNIIVVANTNSDGAGGFDFLIAKYNSSGVLQWDRTLGGTGLEICNGVAVDSLDNIIGTGYTNSDGAGSYDLLVVKYSSSGVLQWDRTLGGTGDDFGYGVATDSLDNIILSGSTASDGAGGNDLLLAKYNSSGVLQWDRTLGGASSEGGNAVAVDSLDNIIVTGSTSSGGAGGADLLIAKYNSSGVLQWDRTLGGAGTEQGQGVAIDSLDNIIVTGPTGSDGAGGNDLLLAKYDPSGVLQWDRTLGGTGQDSGKKVAVDSLDNIIVTGQTTSDSAGGDDIFLAKLPSDGSLEGTYGPFTYADAVLTDAEAVLTDAEAVLTDAAAVLTDAVAVLTETKLYTLYTIS